MRTKDKIKDTLAVKKPKVQLSPEMLQRITDKANEISTGQDASYIRAIFYELLIQRIVPVELFDKIPLPAHEVGKTRFDQIYDACMALVFPEYREETTERLLGPSADDTKVKFWRAIFPEHLQIYHVILRAHTYQEAFALACDYACRVSLRTQGKIPVDLTVRVLFMSERAARRYLGVREAVRSSKRHLLKLEGRSYTNRQINGARLCALGPPTQPNYSIVRYIEMKDLRQVRNRFKKKRVSAVDSEKYRKPKSM